MRQYTVTVSFAMDGETDTFTTTAYARNEEEASGIALRRLQHEYGSYPDELTDLTVSPCS